MTDNEHPSKPRSFGDLSPTEQKGPVVGEGHTPWGQAKPVKEVYAILDHWHDGSITIAEFHDVGKAVELFETARITVAMGTLKGCRFIGSTGELVDEIGTFNEGSPYDRKE